MDGVLRFELLGPPRVLQGGEELAAGGPKPRAVLAVTERYRAGRQADALDTYAQLGATRPAPERRRHRDRQGIAPLRTGRLT